MGMRLEPADEYTHELGPEPNFNESMYINVFDPAHQLGAWFRLGNRANEGHAEMTVCIYLPDGRVAFMFKRPPIDDNERLDVYNGLLLAPHLDALFDAGWATFDSTGELRLAAGLDPAAREALGLVRPLKIISLVERHQIYLAFHREHVFRGVLV